MRLFVHELKAQQRLFWRSRELAFFTFLLPVLLFFLLGSVYGDDEVEGVRGADYLLAGMLGYGAISTAFAGLAILLVIRREQGILKRLRATPLPASTYLGGGAGLDRARLRAGGGADDRDRPPRLRHGAARAAGVSGPRPAARRGRLRGAGRRRSRVSFAARKVPRRS